MKQTTTTVPREQLIKALQAEWVWITKEDGKYNEPDPDDDTPEENLEFLQGCSYELLVEQALKMESSRLKNLSTTGHLTLFLNMTRLLALLLNKLPPRYCILFPRAVVQEAIYIVALEKRNN
jgi:hypothetical protein